MPEKPANKIMGLGIIEGDFVNFLCGRPRNFFYLGEFWLNDRHNPGPVTQLFIQASSFGSTSFSHPPPYYAGVDRVVFGSAGL